MPIARCTCMTNNYLHSSFKFVKTRLSRYVDAGAEFCYYDGKRYAEGTSFKIDCNTCTCLENGLAACTKMACLGICNNYVLFCLI